MVWSVSMLARMKLSQLSSCSSIMKKWSCSWWCTKKIQNGGILNRHNGKEPEVIQNELSYGSGDEPTFF